VIVAEIACSISNSMAVCSGGNNITARHIESGGNSSVMQYLWQQLSELLSVSKIATESWGSDDINNFKCAASGDSGCYSKLVTGQKKHAAINCQ